MNLNELIEALIELRDSGKALDRTPVVFVTRRLKNKKPINRIKTSTHNNNSFSGIEDCIELHS